jgi:phosphoserine phosphatase RsbU/P
VSVEDRKTILVIDDDPAIVKLMVRTLQHEGYVVFSADNGQSGIDQLKHIKPDLIILDMDMPKMNGLDFLKHIRDEKMTKVPVLILSGTSELDLIIESYQYGVYDFIRKPENTGVMLKRVENGLKIGEIVSFNNYIKIELAMSRVLQSHLFPPERFTGEFFNISAWTVPLTDIGGDLYDYILFRDNRLIFILADVSGHSISAALFIANVKMIFRNGVKLYDDPGEILTYINREIGDSMPTGSFVTLFCGLVDPEKYLFHYSNGGHPLPLMIRQGKNLVVEEAEPFLGPIPETQYSTKTIKLEKRDRIIIFSDGIQDWISLNNCARCREYLYNELKDSSFHDGVEKIKKTIAESERRIDDCSLIAVEIL